MALENGSSYASIGGSVRLRNGIMGGSLRCPPSRRMQPPSWRIPAQHNIASIDEDLVSLNGKCKNLLAM